MDTLEPGRSLNLTAVPNMRDLGGYTTSTGRRVRPDLVFRAGQLDHLDAAAVTAFGELGIRSVFDLRTEGERAVGADHVPTDVAVTVFDVLADQPGGTAAQLNRLDGDADQITAALGDGSAIALLEACYRDFVTLPSAHQSYRGLFTALADDTSGPSVFHCTAGKDRTGWGAAVLLLHLGVDEDTVFANYLESNTYARPSFQKYLDQFEAKGGDPAVLAPVFDVEPRYLEAGLAQVRAEYGDITGYLTTGLGLPPEVLTALETRLLQD